MTIPTLIANTNSQKFRSQFKKSISTLSQAARMSEAQYGFDYAGINQVCGTDAATEHPDTVMSICSLLNGTLTGTTYYDNAADIPMKVKNTNTTYTITSNQMEFWGLSLSRMHAYVLSDGSIFLFSKTLGSNACTLPAGTLLEDNYSGDVGMNHCAGFIDVNGTSLPNKEVSCSSGENTIASNNCVVKNDANHLTDIYPVRIHDGIVEPATAAARYVLKTAK